MSNMSKELAELPRSPIQIWDKVIVTVDPNGERPGGALLCARDTTYGKAYTIAGADYCELTGDLLGYYFIDDVGDYVHLQEEHLTKVV